MTLLLGVWLRSVLIILATLAVGALCRRRSASVRHTVLACGILACGVIVPLTVLAPRWVILRAPAVQSFASRASSNVSVNQDEPTGSVVSSRPPPFNMAPVVLAVWGLGSLGGLLLLAVGLRRLSRLTSSADPVVTGPWRDVTDEVAARYGIGRTVSVRRTEVPGVLATWGWRRPCLLVPREAQNWSTPLIRAVVGHELAHVRRGDWPVQMLVDVVRAMFWVNPMIWIASRRLRAEAERACDDSVLHDGMSGTAYAEHLLEIVRACRVTPTSVPALSIGGRPTLEGRIAMLLKRDRDRRVPTRRAVAVIVAGIAVVSGLIAAVGVSAQSRPGTLTGHVYDMSGAVLPAVDVVLEDARQVKWPTTTDSSGRFEFSPVGNGKYTLHVSQAGFRTLKDEFELAATSRWDRSVTLQVGEIEETIQVTARRPAPRPATGGTSAPEPVRIGGNIKPPVKLTNVAPVYPPAMQAAGLEGTVPMEALIAQDGSVTSVRMLSAQVHPDFARAAEVATRQWRFSQTLLNGVPVDVRMVVSVRFSLTD